MTTSPFQSILDMVQQPEATETPAAEEQPHASLDETIASFFARRTTNSSSSSADFGGPSEDRASDEGTSSSGQRPSLQGGEHSEAAALDLLNSHFMVGKSKQETAIFRINDDGTTSFVPTEEFKLAVQNIFVKVGSK